MVSRSDGSWQSRSNINADIELAGAMPLFGSGVSKIAKNTPLLDHFNIGEILCFIWKMAEPDTEEKQFSKGVEVLARWKDGIWYLANVQEVGCFGLTAWLNYGSSIKITDLLWHRMAHLRSRTSNFDLAPNILKSICQTSYFVSDVFKIIANFSQNMYPLYFFCIDNE